MCANKFLIQIISVINIDLPYELYFEYPKGRTLKFANWADAQAFALKKISSQVKYKIVAEDIKTSAMTNVHYLNG